MTIGIIGSGAIGTAFARTLSRAGIKATISNSRGPDSLKELMRELGPSIKAGTREEAARADIVFVAVNWTKLQAALAGLPDWSGRILIDANNPIEAPLFKPVELKGRASSEVVAELAPGARVVKAFIGFVGIDLGSLEVGGRLAQFPGGPLPNQNLVKVG